MEVFPILTTNCSLNSKLRIIIWRIEEFDEGVFLIENANVPWCRLKRKNIDRNSVKKKKLQRNLKGYRYLQMQKLILI